MKSNIHPTSTEVTITCTCGAKTKTVSTLGKDFGVELCSHCHPFFTGKQRLVDSTGRVERFQKRYAKFQQQKKGATEPKPETPKDETTENQ